MVGIDTSATHSAPQGRGVEQGVPLPPELRYSVEFDPGESLTVYKLAGGKYVQAGSVDPGDSTFVGDLAVVAEDEDATVLVDSMRGVGVRVFPGEVTQPQELDDLVDKGKVGRYALLLDRIDRQLTGMPPGFNPLAGYR